MDEVPATDHLLRSCQRWRPNLDIGGERRHLLHGHGDPNMEPCRQVDAAVVRQDRIYAGALDLWFGFSAKDRLSAVDLSNLDSRPRIAVTWKEFDPPEDWQELQEPQLVSLGSGKFCIARFFHTTVIAGYYGDEFTDRSFGVLTGVEVLPRVYERNGNGSGYVNASSNDDSTGICNGGNGHGGKRKLRMVKHKSRCHVSANGTVIESVF